MKYLIVNGDDFGAGRGVNLGIIRAHRRGILTSASLMVGASWSGEAAALSRSESRLSVGLHADLDRVLATGGDPRALRDALRDQLARFHELTGRAPTHLDSHHDAHRDPRALPHFLELAQEQGLPLREHSPVRSFSKFYGQWGGLTHWEQIGAQSLARILETEVVPGVTELICHPGYRDPDFASGYAAEREAELRALCDPLPRRALDSRSIRLVSYRDLDGALRGLRHEGDSCSRS